MKQTVSITDQIAMSVSVAAIDAQRRHTHTGGGGEFVTPQFIRCSTRLCQCGGRVHAAVYISGRGRSDIVVPVGYIVLLKIPPRDINILAQTDVW